MKRKNKELLVETIKLLYPVTIILGLYLIIYGHNSPGGGFQGGVVLASSYIIKHTVDDSVKVNLKQINYYEKILYFLLLLFSFMIIILSLDFVDISLRKYFIIMLNLIIGLKVCFATLIIFFRFVFYEDVR